MQDIQKANHQKQKQKLLKKYLDNHNKNNNKNKFNSTFNTFLVIDNDQSNDQSSLNQSQESSEQSIKQKKRERIQSDEQGQKDIKNILQKSLGLPKFQENQNEILKNKKIKKKFKKIFGIEDEQIQDFLKQIKIEGTNLKQIKKLLKSKNVSIQMQRNQTNQTKKDKKKKKKQKKQQIQHKVKFQSMLSQSSSSDFQIPEQSRTIYRNKDGTVKLHTNIELKQQKKKQVESRLAEWQKGMKAQDSDSADDQDMAHAKNQVWDDPLKLWNEQNLVKPFQCRFEGPANRFNIKPGCRWDGVIRGNGFENRIIQEQNLKKAKTARQHKQYLKNL